MASWMIAWMSGVALAGNPAVGADVSAGVNAAPAAAAVLPPAAVPTHIVPDAAGHMTTGTTVTASAGTYGTVWTIGGGVYNGPASNPYQNLFHSFSDFDLANRETALWSGPHTGDVRYVISRVTGGEVSRIDGWMESDFTHSQFFFINPAGVVFGRNASFSVGALYLSTANTLNFDDGSQLVAMGGGGSTFSMASPESFGFLGGQSGNLVFEGGERDIVRGGWGGRVSHFSSANIALTDTALSFGGLTRLAAVGDASLSLSLSPLDPLPALEGRISLRNSQIYASGYNANDFRGSNALFAMSAGELRLVGTDLVLGPSSMSFNSGDADIQMGGIFMEGAAHIGMFGSDAPEQDRLTIRIRDVLSMQGDSASRLVSVIGQNQFGSSVGRARIEILGESATLRMNDASLNLRSSGTCRDCQGSMFVKVKELIMINSEVISSSNFPLIANNANNFEIFAHDIYAENSSFDSYTTGGGSGGDIRLSSREIYFSESNVNASAHGDGVAGNIVIDGEALNFKHSIISNGTMGNGNGGSVTIKGRDIILDHSIISSDTFVSGRGDGGNIYIKANDIELNYSTIEVGTQGAGNAGSINIEADGELFSNSTSRITATTAGSGRGGQIVLSAGDVLFQGTAISSAATSSGNAGDIFIESTSGSIRDNSSSISSSALGDTVTGAAGSVRLRSAHDVQLSRTTITSQALGQSARAGSIDILALGSIDIGRSGLPFEDAQISILARSAGTYVPSSDGRASGITIHGQDVTITGGAGRGSSPIPSPGKRVSVSATTNSTHPAGSISITADRNLVLLRTDVEASTMPASGAVPNTGAGGTINLKGRDIHVSNSWVESTTGGSGHAGGILAEASDDLILDQFSHMSVATTGEGDAGDIRLHGGEVAFHGVEVSSTTRSGGDAGNIHVDSTVGPMEDIGSSISSSALGSDVTGAAGTIRLTSAQDLHLMNTNITSKAQGFSKGAGSIDIDAVRAVTIGWSEGTSPSGTELSVTNDSIAPYLQTSAPPTIRIHGQDIDLVGGPLRTNLTSFPIGRVTVRSTTSGDHTAGDIAIMADRNLFLWRSDILGSTLANADGTNMGGGGAVSLSADKLTADNSWIESASLSSGNAGGIHIAANDLTLTDFTNVSSASSGHGAAGNIRIDLGHSGLLEADSRIEADIKGNATSAGNIEIVGADAELTLLNAGGRTTSLTSISSNTGNARTGGAIVMDLRALNIRDGAVVAATATMEPAEEAPGNGGNISLTGGALDMSGSGSLISTSALGTGRAGTIDIRMQHGIRLDDGAGIDSRIFGRGTGAGRIHLQTDGRLELLNSSRITTSSRSDATAGEISVSAPDIVIIGSRVVSENDAPLGGRAGEIRVAADRLWLGDGGMISTNANNGVAGDITLAMPQAGLLMLSGGVEPARITTSSGKSSAGRINIDAPGVIVSRGGEILATTNGDIREAEVRIASTYFVRSWDHINKLTVDGDLVVDSQFRDVSEGADFEDPEIVDASGILTGRCVSVRLSGVVSQLKIAAPGPYEGSVASCAKSGSESEQDRK